MRFHSILAGLVMLACSHNVISQERQNLDANAILIQQQSIRADAEAGKDRYKGMKDTTRQELYKHQDVVSRLLQGKAYTTDLPEHDQVTVFNALESIEAILNNAEDQRMVCERYKPTGSHRVKTLCMTVAQRRAAQEGAKSQIHYRDQQCLKNAQGQCI